MDAQVVVMTPAAFVHMTPDPWVSENLMTIPELLQFAFDVVLIDEVDSFQKTLDGFFAPRAPLMGDERTVYAPSIAVRSSEALRVRSGAQFRHEVNTRWQKRFHNFYGLIGTIYSILQNERAHLVGTVSEAPFTAGSILYDLWSRGITLGGGDLVAEREKGFLNVNRLAAALARSSKAAAAGQQDGKGEAGDPIDPSFKAATDTLRVVAAKIVIEDYYDDALSLIEASLDGALGAFDAWAREGMPPEAKSRVLKGRANAATILLAVLTDLVLLHYGWLARAQAAVATDFGIDDTQLLSQANNLIRHYRTLLPANPAGAVFGLSYDFPKGDDGNGGKLTLTNHLGVGRHLVTHLHDLLGPEGQAGPHVLMLSGTSWAGGRIRRTIRGRREAVASPVFDVQVPVKGVLVQPASETDAIERSIFRLVPCPDGHGVQARASGLDEPDRRNGLKWMAGTVATRRGDSNQIEEHWARVARAWGQDELADRRRALFVTNSYGDAAVVADALAEALGRDWGVRCLVRDRSDDGDDGGRVGPRLAATLPRSLVERFGSMGERSVLVAPLQVVSRGHNILNEAGRAAISSIYFLHRPHPRPDDMSAVVGRLNRFAVERYDLGLSRNTGDETVPARMRRLRHAAARIVREGMDRRSGYSGLPRITSPSSRGTC